MAAAIVLSEKMSPQAATLRLVVRIIGSSDFTGE